MTARSKQSRRPLGGSNPDQLRLEYFVLFLDENLCNCRELLETLQRLGIRYERFTSHFNRGTKDHIWLPDIGKRAWVLVTADKRIRYNELERMAVTRHKVREFVFTSTMSGADYAKAIEAAIGAMRRLCEKQEPPFIATITKSGMVHLRYDKRGSIYRRKEKRRK